MTPQIEVHGLAKPKPWEYALRFCFGGLVAVVASLTSKRLGDFAGGLALAFPAILPAALTLVKEHDGRQQATDDARGARFGAVGLTLFAVVIYLSAREAAPVALAAALLVWAAAGGGLWWLVYGRKPNH